ncbi:MAG: ribonuclease H-like domain-containing protein [Candidatus Paceibacteria bacterium]
MRKITLDIETTSATPGRVDPDAMELAMVCIHDSETDSFESFTKADLVELWPILEHADAIIGYNSNHFDIPIINKYYPGDLSQIKSIDILVSIRESLGRRLKLDSVAEATLGRKKKGSGLDSVQWWRDGEIEKVREYCIEDVRITKEVYEYALKHGNVKYMDFGEKRVVPIDTSVWENGETAAINRTLPI